MAVNTLTNAIPKILAMALLSLRGFTVMPALVNLDYGTDAKEQGDTVDVPIHSAITALAVTHANTPPDDAGITPQKVQIALDRWFEAPFFMSDKDLLEVSRPGSFVPGQIREAAKAIADQINADLFGCYNEVYGFTGTPATTPFGTANDVSDATNLRKVLNSQRAPLGDRRAVLDVDAAAKALTQRSFQDASWRNNDQTIREGQIGRALGFDFFEDQAVPTHTSTALSAGAATVNGAHAVGVTTVSIAKATNASNLVKGDIITFAGDSQTYVVGANVTLAVGNTNVTISPPLKVAQAGGAAMSLKATHVVNLGFHRDAFALAMRPLAAPQGFTGGSIIQSMVDPQTGLTLRIEVSRQHKRTRWAIDALWGKKLVRPELAARLAG